MTNEQLRAFLLAGGGFPGWDIYERMQDPIPPGIDPGTEGYGQWFSRPISGARMMELLNAGYPLNADSGPTVMFQPSSGGSSFMDDFVRSGFASVLGAPFAVTGLQGAGLLPSSAAAGDIGAATILEAPAASGGGGWIDISTGLPTTGPADLTSTWGSTLDVTGSLAPGVISAGSNLTADYLKAADTAGGMVPEYGTIPAYEAGIGVGTGATLPSTVPIPGVPGTGTDKEEKPWWQTPGAITAGGALAGALLGGATGGSKPAGTVTTTESLPDWLLPYAKKGVEDYSTLLTGSNTDPYGIMSAAADEVKKTLEGFYLDPEKNAALNEYFNAGAERVKGALSPRFGHMQAFGQHSGYNEALARGLGDLALGLYGPEYQKERARQFESVGFAPKFTENWQNLTFSPYDRYLRTIAGLGGKRKDEPYFDNPFGNIASGALIGAGLGKGIFG